MSKKKIYYNSDKKDVYYDEIGTQNNFSNQTSDTEDKKTKNKKKLVLLLSVIGIIIIIVGGFFIYKKMEIRSLTKNAESFVEVEDYDSAIKTYSEIYQKTGSPNIKTTINKLKLKQEIANTIADAKKQEQNDNLVKAIVIYKMVPQEDEKSFKLAQDQIDSIKNMIIKKASTMVDTGNTSQATSLLSDYLAVEPDDKKAVDLYKKASGKNDAQIKELVVNKTVPVYVSDSGSANKVANAITGTYQYITSSQANARSGPSKSSPVLTTLYRGDSVYVQSTYVESEQRIWCKTDYGWISYNTMNNTIR